MKVECPRCHTHVEMRPDADPVCPTCGFGAPGSGGAPAVAAAAAPATGASGAPMTAMPTAGPPMTSGSWTNQDGPPAWQGAQAPPLNQTMAITALILGIAGCCLAGPLTGIPAAIFGSIALKRAKDQPTVYGGSGMALTGVILGIIAAILGTLAIIALIVGIASFPDECWADPESVECEEAQKNLAEAEPSLLAMLAAPNAPGPRASWYAI